MAKMNSRGASWSRPIPLGICNHVANAPGRVDTMSSNAKSILYKEMRESERPPLHSTSQPGRTELRTNLLLAAAGLPLLLGRYRGNLSSSKPEILKFTGLSRRCRTQMPQERHRKKRTLYLS